jgi:LmbE family N-acetylglucosaminyl deacetylase
VTQCVFAIAAHPDDIEFLMAGTLILLRRAEWQVHYLCIANGSCGTAELGRDEIVRIRQAEARAAESIGAIYHESLVDDLQIFYERGLLSRVAALMRDVSPDVLLAHSPQDYMEDHQNAARLAVTAAFARGMPNFPTDPPRSPTGRAVTVYHAQPHGNRDPLRRLVYPDLYVDIGNVIDEKRAMLAHHHSQKEWLDRTQGMDAYLDTMVALSREVGGMSGEFTYAEGWRRRLHLGFGAEDDDPLSQVLGAWISRSFALPIDRRCSVRARPVQRHDP